MTPFLIRRKQLKEQVGLAPSTVDLLERRGEFPARRRISENVVGWDADEVQAWVKSREKVGVEK